MSDEVILKILIIQEDDVAVVLRALHGPGGESVVPAEVVLEGGHVHEVVLAGGEDALLENHI